jgi:hypothetical protein
VARETTLQTLADAHQTLRTISALLKEAEHRGSRTAAAAAAAAGTCLSGQAVSTAS